MLYILVLTYVPHGICQTDLSPYSLCQIDMCATWRMPKGRMCHMAYIVVSYVRHGLCETDICATCIMPKGLKCTWHMSERRGIDQKNLCATWHIQAQSDLSSGVYILLKYLILYPTGREF